MWTVVLFQFSTFQLDKFGHNLHNFNFLTLSTQYIMPKFQKRTYKCPFPKKRKEQIFKSYPHFATHIWKQKHLKIEKQYAQKQYAHYQLHFISKLSFEHFNWIALIWHIFFFHLIKMMKFAHESQHPKQYQILSSLKMTIKGNGIVVTCGT